MSRKVRDTARADGREEFARLAKEASDSRDAMREMKDATRELESARSRLEIEQAHVDRMTKLRDHARQLMTEGKTEPETLAQAQLDLDHATRKLEAVLNFARADYAALANVFQADGQGGLLAEQFPGPYLNGRLRFLQEQAEQ